LPLRPSFSIYFLIPKLIFNEPPVFIFTTALFLSGYVLQQQTVRDLRAAIKPQLLRPKPGPDLYLPPQFRDAEYWEARGVVDAVQIDESVAKSKGGEEVIGSENVAEEETMIGATRWQKAAARKKKLKEEQGLKEGQKIISGDQGGGEKGGEEEALPKPPEKPVSRAERRRKIKEQILAEGEGEGFKGYRRRTW
jgi:hypothetical protein